MTSILSESDKVALRKKFRMECAIAERAEAEIENLEKWTDRQSLLMDLDSVALDLDKLLAAPPFDFVHDILGIIRHMDRRTYPGVLRNCFVPRCAAIAKAEKGGSL